MVKWGDVSAEEADGRNSRQKIDQDNQETPGEKAEGQAFGAESVRAFRRDRLPVRGEPCAERGVVRAGGQTGAISAGDTDNTGRSGRAATRPAAKGRSRADGNAPGTAAFTQTKPAGGTGKPTSGTDTPAEYAVTDGSRQAAPDRARRARAACVRASACRDGFPGTAARFGTDGQPSRTAAPGAAPGGRFAVCRSPGAERGDARARA